ncbi:PAS domain S-box protein [Thalassospira sp. HF15]|uniref:PAS domain S-box protein n=1 Tax=Thalassospira sp. HF15 TaxID=2722755 RepID=UPI001431A7CF|nr:PAS domain S-box protein [Thalassospira sp. HF15]NIY74627.1 PAS domain S-box protein [Thalassospira sp. HF15]
MKKPLLLVKILTPMILVALVIGIGSLQVLYKDMVKARSASMLSLAETNAELINAVAAYDYREAPSDHKEDAFAATMSQVEDAFNSLSALEGTEELLVVRRINDALEILVHQETKVKERSHSETVPVNSDYARPMLEGLAGKSGLMWVFDDADNELLVAYAPVPKLAVSVIVEATWDDMIAPFVSTAIMLITLGIGAIGVATAYTYTQIMQLFKGTLRAQDQAQQALKEAEAAQNVLEHALKSSGEGFALFDAEDRLVICNDVYRDIYKTHADAIKKGNSFEEILRTGLSRGAFPDAIGVEEIWLADRLQQHRLPTSRVEQQVGDRWLLISEQRIEGGGTVGVRTDITELKNKERELRDSERRFRDFTQTASDWVWETDANHRIKDTSIRAADVPNFDIDNLQGKRRDEYAAEPTDTPKWREHYETLEARQPFRDFQYQVQLNDRTVLTISISGVPVFDDVGNFLGYRGTGRDITALIETRERFRVAFESVTVGIVFADEEGVIEGFNPKAENIFGYSAEQVIGQNVSMLMPNPDSSRHHTYIKNYLSTGEAQIIGIGREVKGKKQDGTIFPMNLGIAEMNVQGRRHFIASITDLTAEHALEQQLRRSQKMEAIGQLTGGVAHDFNNLLGIIVGNLDLARRKIDDDSPISKFVSKAMTAAERGATLTRRLLNFSRQAPEENAAVVINDILAELRELIGKSITSKIGFELKLADNLPAVRLNVGDFEDAIINLAINARDAMPDGGQLTIETRVSHIDAITVPAVQKVPEGDYVELIVSDDGKGMTPEIAEQIFQPFFTTKERGKGTGLGLAMVYGFVKRSGGYISLYSESGLGTTFRIYLPFADEDGQKVPYSKFNIEAEAEPEHGNETVLIVDDEQQLAEIAASVLAEYGYTTITAHSGKEGLAIVEERDDIDMVFTDIVMPGGINGLELGDKVREIRPNIAVLTCSGFTAGVLHERAGDKPVYPLVNKPYTNRELANAVRKTLDQTSSDQTGAF